MTDTVYDKYGRKEPNPYLFEIENKKKGGLLHEQGQGSPCLKCQDKCSGFELHFWRKICNNCRCPKDDHDLPAPIIDPGKIKIGRLFDKPPTAIRPFSSTAAPQQAVSETTTPQTGNAATNTPEFMWIPPGVSPSLAEKYMAQLPQESRPIKGSLGAQNRAKLIEKQLPDYDLDSKACSSLSQTEASLLDSYIDDVKKNVVGQGTVEELPTAVVSPVKQDATSCTQCEGHLKGGDVAIKADRAGSNKLWHPACFTCETCKELIADLIYFYQDGKIYCGRHFAEKYFPRCKACDELIFAKKWTKADGFDWHYDHFCCHYCDLPLAGKEYIPNDDSQPCCLDCNETRFRKTCLTCNAIIKTGTSRVSFGTCHYHATSECFCCSFCRINLMNQKFISKPPKVFCSANCKNQML